MEDFAWAFNKVKLGRATSWAKEQKKLNAAFEVNEESIKTRYIALGGKLVADDETVIQQEGSDGRRIVKKEKSKK